MADMEELSLPDTVDDDGVHVPLEELPHDTDEDVPQKKSAHPCCLVDGCGNKAQQGGRCKKHGGKRIRNRTLCSVEGCTNQALKTREPGILTRKECSYMVKVGFCWSHGAEMVDDGRPQKKRSEYTGMADMEELSLPDTVDDEGAHVPPEELPHDTDEDVPQKKSAHPCCLVDGCGNKAQQGGRCKKHGGKRIRNRTLCSVEGCTNQALKTREPGILTRKECSYMVKVGFCWNHGAEMVEDGRPQKKRDRPRCSVDGCKLNAAEGGICCKHGGKRIRNVKPCSFEGCDLQAHRGGVCWQHVRASYYLCYWNF